MNVYSLMDASKKFLTEYIEKIILLLLILVMVITLLKSGGALVRELTHQEELLSRPFDKETTDPLKEMISPERYSALLKTLQTHFDDHQETRNLFAQKVQENTNKTGEESVIKVDSDHDGMPDEWETRYGLDAADPSDAGKDLDHDHYSNLDEYIGGSDPSDPNSFPGMIKLKVMKIYRLGIRVNFFGYIKLPDGSFQMQINWGRHTTFLKEGEEIRGYKIITFTQDSEKKFIPQINAEEVVDTSYIKIQRSNDPPLTLILGKPSFKKELYAAIKDETKGKTYTVHAGSKIKSYKVLDITSSKVIIFQKKRSYTLSLQTN